MSEVSLDLEQELHFGQIQLFRPQLLACLVVLWALMMLASINDVREVT